MDVRVVRVAAAERPLLRRLLRAVEAEAQPGDPGAPDRAERGLERSLARFDALASDACRVIVACVGDEPAGYLAAVRIPKLDARRGFLFVDELYVLERHRRRGVAATLLDEAARVCDELGCAGIRLLVRPATAAGRALYRAAGFREQPLLLCERAR